MLLLLHYVFEEKKSVAATQMLSMLRQSYSVPQWIIYIFIYLFSLNCVVRQDHILLVTLLMYRAWVHVFHCVYRLVPQFFCCDSWAHDLNQNCVLLDHAAYSHVRLTKPSQDVKVWPWLNRQRMRTHSRHIFKTRLAVHLRISVDVIMLTMPYTALYSW